MRYQNTQTYNPPRMRRLRENESARKLKGSENDDGRSYDGRISQVQGKDLRSTHSRKSSFTTIRVSSDPDVTHVQSLPSFQNDSDSSNAQCTSSDECSSVSDWYPTTDANDWLHSSPSTSPTPSISHENAMPIRKRRPRFSETCRTWMQGRCERGYNCRYIHGDLEYEHPPDISNSQRQNKPLFSQWTFTMYDHIKVRVGPGLAVESVTTGFETPWIHITGLPSTITTDELSQLLQKYGAVHDVKIHSRRLPIIAAKARFSNYPEAQAANTALDGTSQWGSTISAKLSLSTTDGRAAVIDETTVKIRWEAPSKQAYAGYPTLERAEQAISVARLRYSENFISAQIHVGIPAVGRHTVHFRNLPIKTEKKHMFQYAQPEDVMWEKVNYNHVTYATNGLKRILEYKNIEYLNFEVLPPPYRDGYVRAWVHFTSSAAAKAAVAALHHYNPRCTGKTRVFADHVLSLSYRIPLLRYSRAVHEVDDLRTTLWQRGKRSSTISFTQHENSVTVKLSATDVKELGELKVELERVLEGETVCLDGNPIWDGYFNRAEGRTYLRQLEVEYAPVTILERPQSRRLVIFGHPSKRALVAREVLNKYKEISGGEFRYLPIPGHLMGPFLGRQFGPLTLLLGPENVTLDMWNQKLRIRGKLSDFRAARQALEKIRTPSRAKATSCPICFGEVELPIILSCRHSYCRTCLSSYLLAAKDNHHFPLSCLGHNAKCPTLIPLSVVQELLPVTTFHALAEAAFTSHIDTHPAEFHYCPSPDCTQVYRPAPPGTVLQCPSCLVKICPRCHVEYHEGFDCPEKEGGDRLFDEWARDHGIKHCPGCKIPIERTEGCNHVTCTRCRSHICWVCMETFPRGEGIYSHMRAEHGGIGI
ncbi:hypothetical protein E1B28_007277 [Marasmius oreades]|uniref:RBR-type E3 ubiquitin transferase n=1 Tax=Marasmius oreades TaxID=181124 RepID=A0A9P7S1I0_9AGAR|nr:uncharacterized protein E1B28_007277 [Marasmius oreades]KAG7093612.1 hypothetical protein E1B28_007277 [Marasmius oreades]